MSPSASRSLIVLCVLLVHTVPALAIRVQGYARDAFSRLPMQGVVVVINVEGVRMEQCSTRMDGFYRFEVPAGRKCRVRFERNDRLPRHVIIDTREVPREWVDALELELDMRLFPSMAGLDSILLNAPAGTARWDAVAETIAWDTATSGPILDRWNTLLALYAEDHPEVRPSATQRLALKGFELVRGYGAILSFVFCGLLYIASRALLDRMSRVARIVMLLILSGGAVWLVVELAHDAGPLRYLAFVALVTGVVAVFNVVVEIRVGGRIKASVEEVVFEEKEDLTCEARHELIEESSNYRWKGFMPLSVFFVALFTCIFEGRRGLENTLDVWPLVGRGAAVGLAAALAITWVRMPALVRRLPRILLIGGGAWWLIMPLFGVAAASFVNRNYAMAEETCHTWPVVELTRTRRRLNVYVSWAGERERLEMPRVIKEQLTTLDSLRCCSRKGFFGFDHVVRVEPVIAPDDRR